MGRLRVTWLRKPKPTNGCTAIGIIIVIIIIIDIKVRRGCKTL
jgi:hypothetical protein